MGNKNYTKYSKNEENEVIENEKEVEVEETETEVEVEETETEVETEVEVEETETEVEVEETETEVEQVAVTPGVVANCKALNVREEANKDSKVLCVIANNTDVQVDLENSTEDFYKVVTSAGVEGYCVKEFIEIE